MGHRLPGPQFAAIAKALSDPRRHRILSEVASATGPLPCCKLGAAKGVTAATVSHHIRSLEAAGLIDIVREGRFALLSFRREAFEAYLRELADSLRPAT